ncbi:hypothetical protein HanRHA438_Chr04g0156351 [Helianthus annuus]|nr:hypothetical protein HanRHA438_Chr04g0156351 [Helianthus annuus]
MSSSLLWYAFMNNPLTNTTRNLFGSETALRFMVAFLSASVMRELRYLHDFFLIN